MRQQLDSFDQFLLNTIEEVLEDTAPLQIKPHEQYTPGAQTSEVGTACHLAQPTSWAFNATTIFCSDGMRLSSASRASLSRQCVKQTQVARNYKL